MESQDAEPTLQHVLLLFALQVVVWDKMATSWTETEIKLAVGEGAAVEGDLRVDLGQLLLRAAWKWYLSVQHSLQRWSGMPLSTQEWAAWWHCVPAADSAAYL